MTGKRLWAAAAALAGAVLVGVSQGGITTLPDSVAASLPTTAVAAHEQRSTDDVERALASLESLRVKGRAPKTGYSRDQYGQAWSDDVSAEGGHNGCDTRNDLLRRSLTEISIKPRSNGCTVLSGVLDDPYTGQMITFKRGRETSDAVQIDHVVALSNSWQTGAQGWSDDKRRNFANDPRNLLAVDGPANMQKGDGDAATWLPPNKRIRCTYVAMQIEVKAEYGLWVTPAEREAMHRILRSCTGPLLRPGPIPEPA